MGDYFYLFLAVLLVIAMLLGEDFVLTLIYLLLGALFLGRWWSRRALRGLVVRRYFVSHAFWGERVPVRLEIVNSSWLPLVWLHLRESLPVELAYPAVYQRVVSIGPSGKAQFEYELKGHKRGLYQVGPINLYSGDVLGLVAPQRFTGEPDQLTVYPKIIPLTSVELLSSSPLGTLRYRQPIFEDPTRMRGKRDYVAGDSLRRVDWKASAASGRLQVKQFEPSIALETAILLNLHSEDYDSRTRLDSAELAIIVAASLAYWIIGRRQSVGLITNGADPLNGGRASPPVPPRRGRSHLMRLLEVMARVQLGETVPFVQLLNREVVQFSWGTTLLLITGGVSNDLFDALFAVRRAGLNAMLMIAGYGAVKPEERRQAQAFGFPLTLIQDERDLDIWRK